MRIAYLDCFSGISGDMFLGALVDAGVSPDLLKQTVAALHLGAELEITKVDRSGITATKVDVIVDGEKDEPRVEHDHGDRKHGHSRQHAHERVTGHAHSSEEVGLLKHNFPRVAPIPESMKRAKEAQAGHKHD